MWRGSHTTEEKWPYPQKRKPAWVLELQRDEEGDPMQRRCDLGCQPTGRMRETHIRRVAQSSVIGSRWGDEDLSQRRESSKWFWTWIEKNLLGKFEDPFCFVMFSGLRLYPTKICSWCQCAVLTSKLFTCQSWNRKLWLSLTNVKLAWSPVFVLSLVGENGSQASILTLLSSIFQVYPLTLVEIIFVENFLTTTLAMFEVIAYTKK